MNSLRDLWRIDWWAFSYQIRPSKAAGSDFLDTSQKLYVGTCIQPMFSSGQLTRVTKKNFEETKMPTKSSHSFFIARVSNFTICQHAKKRFLNQVGASYSLTQPFQQANQPWESTVLVAPWFAGKTSGELDITVIFRWFLGSIPFKTRGHKRS